LNSWARISAGFAPRTRAFLNLTLLRDGYARILAELPRFNGPTLVVGSAPEPHRPVGLNHDWSVVTVNASQITSDDFGLKKPDLTVFRDDICGSGTHQNAVWAALRGKQTTHVIANMGSSDDAGIAAFMATQNYRAEHVTELNRHVRGAIIADVSGRYYVKVTAGVSNGIFATLLALKLGASPVVMSGFSFTPGWYFAPGIPGARGHIPADKVICRAIVERGLPVFAADPAFAENSGLPLWTGSAGLTLPH
jgi:hypothetical protein